MPLTSWDKCALNLSHPDSHSAHPQTVLVAPCPPRSQFACLHSAQGLRPGLPSLACGATPAVRVCWDPRPATSPALRSPGPAADAPGRPCRPRPRPRVGAPPAVPTLKFRCWAWQPSPWDRSCPLGPRGGLTACRALFQPPQPQPRVSQRSSQTLLPPPAPGCPPQPRPPLCALSARGRARAAARACPLAPAVPPPRSPPPLARPACP